MTMVIDADAHANEPDDLFDRYLERDFKEDGPEVVSIGKVQYWMVEGKLFPASGWKLGSWHAEWISVQKKENLIWRSTPRDSTTLKVGWKDLDKEGIDIQVAYPNIMAMASHLDNGDLAAAMCRAYNNYTAGEKSKAFDGRVRGIAAVPLQKPEEAAKEFKKRSRISDLWERWLRELSDLVISMIRTSILFSVKPMNLAQRWGCIRSLAALIARGRNGLRIRISIFTWLVCHSI